MIKNNWQKLTEFIDENEEFDRAQIKTLNLRPSLVDQYRHYLIKGGYIESAGPWKWRRLNRINGFSIYKLKEVILDLEVDEVNHG